MTYNIMDLHAILERLRGVNLTAKHYATALTDLIRKKGPNLG
jgi:hypothetical protein